MNFFILDTVYLIPLFLQLEIVIVINAKETTRTCLRSAQQQAKASEKKEVSQPRLAGKEVKPVAGTHPELNSKILAKNAITTIPEKSMPKPDVVYARALQNNFLGVLISENYETSLKKYNIRKNDREQLCNLKNFMNDRTNFISGIQQSEVETELYQEHNTLYHWLYNLAQEEAKNPSVMPIELVALVADYCSQTLMGYSYKSTNNYFHWRELKNPDASVALFTNVLADSMRLDKQANLIFTITSQFTECVRKEQKEQYQVFVLKLKEVIRQYQERYDIMRQSGEFNLTNLTNLTKSNQLDTEARLLIKEALHFIECIPEEKKPEYQDFMVIFNKLIKQYQKRYNNMKHPEQELQK